MIPQNRWHSISWKWQGVTDAYLLALGGWQPQQWTVVIIEHIGTVDALTFEKEGRIIYVVYDK